MKCAYNYLKSRSLKLQFICAFTFVTLVILMVSIMVVSKQIKQARISTTARLDELNSQDYRTATLLTAKSIKFGILGYFMALSQQLYNLQLTHEYFQSSPGIFNSTESTSPLNPPSSFTASPNYSSPALLKFDSTNSNNYEEFSYFDVMLPTLLASSPDIVKRINILFINPTNLTQTAIRTYPATSDFKLKRNNTRLFSTLLAENTPGAVLISLPYMDYYANTGILMYLGTQIYFNESLTLILQAQMIVEPLQAYFYSKVIYFPNAILGYVFTANNKSELFSCSSDEDINMTDIMANNLSKVMISGNEYLVALTSFPMTFQINNISSIFQNPSGPYSIMVLSPISSMSSPSESFMSYLSNLTYMSNFSLGVSTMITLMAVIAFSFLAANLITYPLNKLNKGIKMYLAGSAAVEVSHMLNSFVSKHQLRELITNSLGIMEQVDQRKGSRAGGVINDNNYEFPENSCDTEFLKTMRCGALEVWEPIESGLQKIRRDDSDIINSY